MAEYAVLTARATAQAVSNWSHQIRMEQVIPVVAAAILVWLLWRTFGPR
jgi:heme/copper-type cytochrome/quinol oxidase subunit 2